ncbi:MAG: stage II sporulation protein R [Clostridia bacterium]|jgi:stage II sporulation protein R|nr:stage II sporulation protein R [Clostridiales bacterium]
MRKPMVYILILALAVCSVYAFAARGGDSMPVTDALLRFHIIANSDSPEDQALKLKVRDRIVSEIGGVVSGMETKEEIIEFLRGNMEYIETIAGQEVMNGNMEYGARGEVGQFLFPTRSYGSLVLPAGSYNALRIVLGDGKGANWWCVMFPPLCFVDTKSSVALAKDQQRIEEMLDGEGPDVLYSVDEMEEVQVRVRFKVLELIKQSGTKLAETFK